MNPCGSDGCQGSCGNCAPGYTCNSSSYGSCVCQPYCVTTSMPCGGDGCGGSCGTCGNGYTCNTTGYCVPSCNPQCSNKQCGNNGCGGSCGTCGNGKTCSSSGQCVSNYPSCPSGCTAHYGMQNIDMPYPNNLGYTPGNVSCTYSGPSYYPGNPSMCQVCSPNGRVYITPVYNYAEQTTTFTISVRCGGNKVSVYTTYMTYGSADISLQYSSWPANDVYITAGLCYSNDRAWVRYEWCDDQGYYGQWVTKVSSPSYNGGW